MAHLDWEVGRRVARPAKFIKTRKSFPPKGQVGDAANTAQWYEFDVPTDMLLHSILITCGYDTTATATSRGDTLANNIVDIEVVINGYLYVKRLKGTMSKALAIQKRGQALSTGFYRVDFVDPKIPESRPLPTFLDEIDNVKLRIQDQAAGSLQYQHIIPTYLEEVCPLEDREACKGFPLLVEAYSYKLDMGTKTGWVEDKYEHERTQKIYGYLYRLTDGGTDEDPAVNGYKWFKMEGRSPAGIDWIIEEMYLLDQKEINEHQYKAALPTGYVAVDFPIPLDTRLYSNLYTHFNIDTAAGAAQVWVCERYLLR